MSKYDASTGADPLASHEMRETDPDHINTDGDRTGVSDHARLQFLKRSNAPLMVAVRRSWEAGRPVDVPDADPDEHHRFDPLTGLVLVVTDQQVVTVKDPSNYHPAMAECLREQGVPVDE